jgi:hypothetical protein
LTEFYFFLGLAFCDLPDQNHCRGLRLSKSKNEKQPRSCRWSEGPSSLGISVACLNLHFMVLQLALCLHFQVSENRSKHAYLIGALTFMYSSNSPDAAPAPTR